MNIPPSLIACPLFLQRARMAITGNIPKSPLIRALGDFHLISIISEVVFEGHLALSEPDDDGLIHYSTRFEIGGKQKNGEHFMRRGIIAGLLWLEIPDNETSLSPPVNDFAGRVIIHEVMDRAEVDSPAKAAE